MGYLEECAFLARRENRFCADGCGRYSDTISWRRGEDGELERVATWVEVLTGLELDERGSARVLDSTTWLQRREKLKQLGGSPVVGFER